MSPQNMNLVGIYLEEIAEGHVPSMNSPEAYAYREFRRAEAEIANSKPQRRAVRLRRI
jgi:hypothetical protein